MSALIGLGALCSGLFGLFGAVMFPVIIGHAILKPMQQAAKRARSRTQFMLTDFIWLFVQLQICLAAVVAYVPEEMTFYLSVLLGYLALAVGTMWYGAVRYLSRAGIRGVWRRAAFILIVLPMVVTLMIASIAVSISMPIELFMLLGPGRIDGPIAAVIGVTLLILGGASLLIVLLCWLMRLTTNWIAREVQYDVVEAVVATEPFSESAEVSPQAASPADTS